MTEESSSDPAVSPVVASILLVAVTIVLAVSVFVFVLDTGETTSAPATASVDVDQEGIEARLQVTDMGSSDTVVLETPLGTPYNASSVGGETVLLAVGDEDISVYGERGGKRTLVQTEPPQTDVTPDIIVAQDGTGDYRKVQWGVNNSSSGDLIAVKRATYEENVNITRKNITLLAEHGTVIEDAHGTDSEDSARDVVHIGADNVSIQNFIVDGDPIPDDGHYARNCITVAANNVSLVGNDLRNCDSPATETGTGIEIRGIYVTILSSNITGGDLGLNVVDGADTALIRGNHFETNSQYNIQNEDTETVDAQYNDWDTDTPPESVNGSVDTYPERSYDGSNLSTASQYTSDDTTSSGSGSDSDSDPESGDGSSGGSDGGSSTEYISRDSYNTSMDTGTSESSTDGSTDDSTASTNSPPVVDAGPDKSTSEGTQVTLDGSDSYDPDGDTVTYEWDFTNDDSTDATGVTQTHTYDTAGSYTAELTGTDESGETVTDTVNIEVVPSPTVDAGDDTNVNATESLQFTASVSPTSDSNSYEWDFGDGTTSTDKSPTHTYTSHGDYTVTLTVTNEYGASDSDSKTVDVNGIPSASTGPDKTATAGSAVHVSGTGSDSDGDTLSYYWDIDEDGDPEETGPSPSWTYSEAGERTVELTVEDEHGVTATDTMTVNVQEPEANFFDGFESGMSNWNVNYGLSQSSGGYGASTYMAEASASDAGGNLPQVVAQTTPFPDGEKPSKFSFYWKEDSGSQGGGIRLLNSNDQYEAGFATNNPQWVFTDGSGKTQVHDGNGNYDRWVYVELTFDWESNTYTYHVEDTVSQTTRTGTRDLRHGDDLSTISIEDYGNQWGDGYKKDRLFMSFDNIRVED